MKSKLFAYLGLTLEFVGVVAFVGILATANPVSPRRTISEQMGGVAATNAELAQRDRDREHRIKIAKTRDEVAFGAIAAWLVGTVIGLLNWKTTLGKVAVCFGGTLILLYLGCCVIVSFSPVY